MKKIIAFCFLLIISLSLFAQDNPTLKIKLRCKTIVKTQQDPDSIRQVVFSAHDLRKGKIRFAYQTASADSGWKRTIMLEDADGKQLIYNEWRTLTVKASQLRQWLSNSKVLKVYTMAIPSDPEKAKIVRVRRYEIVNVRYSG